MKTYICIFVCFSTKAVHLEPVSYLTIEAFLAAFTRFAARRGCPSHVFSDNGTNFVGANREIQSLLQSDQTKDQFHHYASQHRIRWTFSPSRTPHSGGLWEAGVKSMKVLLKKVVGKHKLTFAELSTMLAEAEATLNSRSLIPIDSTSPDGVSALTPGHFLIGRPLRAPPARVDLVSKECNLKKWNLLHLLNSQFWSRWTKQYLQSLQQRQKWQYRSENLKPGDVVLVKEIDPTRRYWLLARILKVHLGQDGCV